VAVKGAQVDLVSKLFKGCEMEQPVVESLEMMPVVKAEMLIREHQTMLTTLQSIRTIAKKENSFADFRIIRDLINTAIGQ
jgi:hypothetical protein